jgi:tetratricopeptide (TPR) repeat protein
MAWHEATLATEADPRSAYAFTVLGFSQLARSETKTARASFERAVALSDGSGLPYLGLGLVTIRDGDLETGRRLVQMAAHLEPSVALYRSYLGKALFEQDEERLAKEEYDLAIQLDPNDPTRTCIAPTTTCRETSRSRPWTTSSGPRS